MNIVGATPVRVLAWRGDALWVREGNSWTGVVDQADIGEGAVRLETSYARFDGLDEGVNA